MVLRHFLQAPNAVSPQEYNNIDNAASSQATSDNVHKEASKEVYRQHREAPI